MCRILGMIMHAEAEHSPASTWISKIHLCFISEDSVHVSLAYDLPFSVCSLAHAE